MLVLLLLLFGVVGLCCFCNHGKKFIYSSSSTLRKGARLVSFSLVQVRSKRMWLLLTSKFQFAGDSNSQ